MTDKKPPPPSSNPYQPIYESSSSVSTTTSRTNKNTAIPPNPTPDIQICNKPRAAKGGYKTFPGNTVQEKATLHHALTTIIQPKPRHNIRKLVSQHNTCRYLQELNDPNSTLDDLRELAPQIVDQRYLQVTDTIPPQLRYHPDFMNEFYDEHATGQIRITQEIQIETTDITCDADDDEANIQSPKLKRAPPPDHLTPTFNTTIPLSITHLHHHPHQPLILKPRHHIKNKRCSLATTETHSYTHHAQQHPIPTTHQSHPTK